MVEIPKYIKIHDNKIERTMEYRILQKINDRLYLYENTKTGCKQCFDIRDLVEIKSTKRRWATKYENMYKE